MNERVRAVRSAVAFALGITIALCAPASAAIVPGHQRHGSPSKRSQRRHAVKPPTTVKPPTKLWYRVKMVGTSFALFVEDFADGSFGNGTSEAYFKAASRAAVILTEQPDGAVTTDATLAGTVTKASFRFKLHKLDCTDGITTMTQNMKSKLLGDIMLLPDPGGPVRASAGIRIIGTGTTIETKSKIDCFNSAGESFPLRPESKAEYPGPYTSTFLTDDCIKAHVLTLASGRPRFGHPFRIVTYCGADVGTKPDTRLFRIRLAFMFTPCPRGGRDVARC